MALRVLIYAVLFWDREWRLWEERAAQRRARRDPAEPVEPFRLTPVIPVVVHTGAGRWEGFRCVADLMDAPAELLEVAAPKWEPLLWDLAEHTPAELLADPEPFVQMLSVPRAIRAELEELQQVVGEAVTRLGEMASGERLWREALTRFVVGWLVNRRSGADLELLKDTIREHAGSAGIGEELRAMSETGVKSYAEEIWEEAWERGRREERGRAEREVREQVLRVRRADLLAILEERFPVLPPDLPSRIEAITDGEVLQQAVRRALRVSRVEELAELFP
jgi:hypothetical protein